MMSSRRFPRRVFGEGVEPDPRFSLANERTFLAWIRTALALLAAGVALEAVVLPLQPAFRLAASFVLLALGLLVPALAWSGWVATERAMRSGDSLPGSPLTLPLTVGVTLVAALLGGAVLLR